MATVIAVGLTLIAEHSFSSPTRLAPDTTSLGDPIYVEFAAPGQEPVVFRLPPETTVRRFLVVVGYDIALPPQADRRLRSGERVDVDSSGGLTFGRMAGARLMALGLRIPLNQACVDDLVVLPGIGERLAMKIVDFRERNGAIASYDDLLWIPGLGPSALEVLKRHTSL